MVAPRVYAVRVPFYYAAPPPLESGGFDAGADAPTGDAAVFITYATIEVTAFDGRFFWMHVSESPIGYAVPRLGSCSVSVGLSLPSTADRTSVSTSQLMEFETDSLQDLSAGTNTTVQSIFASGLSQKVVRGVAKRFHSQVTVYVNCAIEGERCLALLGTDGGSGFDMTYQFGGLIYREAFAVVARHLEECGSPTQ
ncbi:hypothetical protein ABB37_08853 [Leptomonas pyrrhocoris]|uniref:Uncharacterized protein n=1 Tax=Leptomonas pyrrhocoris TaxID=157538 RepID=A0A0M9FS58_LEPPY|nr:hypothetical protein ABB37_08853 [Leptomonas pyrrhocoris]XP_015653269.1 hypothetical protein ABB37_08853 [Leptomonas pyrrhocoris]KPA74829.1 hypothetical protein ABB37_08853 [Leptomonas pyrrhocoris]KPA74830.1 hypothetical protein ABB37_08853 [Leptomonas pyrrhocoris]|eukprot:XP_015653268.1 hypothetical protein ABB37_08853 [Leptomonas pyrrhocoris]